MGYSSSVDALGNIGAPERLATVLVAGECAPADNQERGPALTGGKDLVLP